MWQATRVALTMQHDVRVLHTQRDFAERAVMSMGLPESAICRPLPPLGGVRRVRHVPDCGDAPPRGWRVAAPRVRRVLGRCWGLWRGGVLQGRSVGAAGRGGCTGARAWRWGRELQHGILPHGILPQGTVGCEGRR